MQRIRTVGGIPVLPAEVRCAGRAQLRERLPRRHRAVHGPLQLLPRRREALVHPLRHAERPDHPVRHLQPVLPQRPHRRDPRAAQGGGDRMSGWDGKRSLATVLFVLFGLPPGLCSFCFTPMAYEMIRHPEGNWDFWRVTFLPWLAGLAIFGVMLGLLIRAWRSRSP